MSDGDKYIFLRHTKMKINCFLRFFSKYLNHSRFIAHKIKLFSLDHMPRLSKAIKKFNSINFQVRSSIIFLHLKKEIQQDTLINYNPKVCVACLYKFTQITLCNITTHHSNSICLRANNFDLCTTFVQVLIMG